jgi:hypothetical protein
MELERLVRVQMIKWRLIMFEVRKPSTAEGGSTLRTGQECIHFGVRHIIKFYMPDRFGLKVSV